MDNIAEIRFEGYYLYEDKDKCIPHTDLTYGLYTKACTMAIDQDYDYCDGITFDFMSGKPYAELIDYEGGLTYEEVKLNQ